MQPKPSLIETQKALATAVRLAHAQPLNGYAPNRLAVYARLVRNNIFGFIDRCFVEKESFDANILALMDFENTQLLAEVSLAKVPEKFEWNKYSVMQLSDAAYLKRYEVDFLSSDFKQFDENPMQAVIWRDSDFNILQQRLSELDFWLLSYIQEQPSSLEEVLSALNTVVEDSTPLIPLLENTWVNWINAEVLYPKV